MVAGTDAIFRPLVRAAVLLTGSVSIREYAVLVHSETGFTDRVTGRKLFRIFSIAFVKRNNTVTMINVLDEIVYSFSCQVHHISGK